jgi:ribonuclease D
MEVSYELIEDRAGVERVAAKLEGVPAFGVDTETTGVDPYTSRLLMVQVALPDGTAAVIDARRAP